MSLYLRGGTWWVSIMRDGRHIQRSTGLADKTLAKTVEYAISIGADAESAKLAAERRAAALDTPATAAARSAACVEATRNREIVENLLRAVYGDWKRHTPLATAWTEYLDVVRVRGAVISRKTMRAKEAEFLRFRKWAGLHEVTHLEEVDGEVAKAFAVDLAMECKAKRRQTIIHDLSAIWKAVVPAHNGVVNPWPSVVPRLNANDRPTRPAFTQEEEERVLEAARHNHPQWFAACVIARDTGFRFGDVCDLEWGNVDFGAGTISIKPNKTLHSSGVSVSIPMSAAVRSCLEEILSSKRFKPIGTDRILPWLRSWGKKREKDRFRSILREAGIDSDQYTFHTWRHTFRSRLASAGVAPEVAMRLCGHTSISTNELYNHHDYAAETRTAIESISQPPPK